MTRPEAKIPASQGRVFVESLSPELEFGLSEVGLNTKGLDPAALKTVRHRLAGIFAHPLDNRDITASAVRNIIESALPESDARNLIEERIMDLFAKHAAPQGVRTAPRPDKFSLDL
ncbi:MAG: hypothetical protein SFT92_01180 [Rickettsiales bacterium]|nr:hypothetical protein [Rickettsiales bacterium]